MIKIRFPRELIERIHRRTHKLIYGSFPDHKAEWYGWFIGYFVKEMYDLKKSMKEVSKQQKYLWQTLEEIIDKLGGLE